MAVATTLWKHLTVSAREGLPDGQAVTRAAGANAGAGPGQRAEQDSLFAPCRIKRRKDCLRQIGYKG
jgi:hypothetical protein